MPLTWDVTKIENYHHITTSPATRGEKVEKWHPVTEQLVWLSMICGFNHITEKNCINIATRIATYQKVRGACMVAQDWPSIYITFEDVKMHIGLQTNASKYSDVKWRQVLIGMIDVEAANIYHGQSNVLRGPVGDIMAASTLSAYEISERIHARLVREAEKETETVVCPTCHTKVEV